VQTTLILQFPADLLEMLLQLCGVRGRTNLARTCHDVHAVRALQQMNTADAEERRQRVQDAFETRRANPVGTLAWGSPLAQGAMPRHLDDHQLLVVVSCPKNSGDDFCLGWLPDDDGQPLIIGCEHRHRTVPKDLLHRPEGRRACKLLATPSASLGIRSLASLRTGIVAALSHMFAKRRRGVTYSA